MEIKIPDIVLTTMTGGITDVEVDATVNVANSYLYMSGGVAGTIRKFGGSIVEKEALKHAPAPIGEAIATTTGKLRAKYVIHAPTLETLAPQQRPIFIRQ